MSIYGKRTRERTQWFEKQKLNTNYAKNPRFVLSDGVLTGWTHNTQPVAVDDGGIEIAYTGTLQTFSIADSAIPKSKMYFNVKVYATGSSTIMLERDNGNEAYILRKSFSLVDDEYRTLYMPANARNGTSTYRIKWYGSADAKINLIWAYISDDPSTDTFSGDDPQEYSADPTLHRSYEWDGDPYASFSHQFSGGFYSAEWLTPPAMKSMEKKPPEVRKTFRDDFNVEISYGAEWQSLNDHLNFKVAAEDMGTSSTAWRRKEVASSFYNGTFLVHATKENVSEALSIWVYGQSQNDVSENLALLSELFSQDRFHIRVRYGDHQETWFCMTSDYSIERTHVYMHNQMAVFKAQVPRRPDKKTELVL